MPQYPHQLRRFAFGGPSDSLSAPNRTDPSTGNITSGAFSQNVQGSPLNTASGNNGYGDTGGNNSSGGISGLGNFEDGRNSGQSSAAGSPAASTSSQTSSPMGMSFSAPVASGVNSLSPPSAESIFKDTEDGYRGPSKIGNGKITGGSIVGTTSPGYTNYNAPTFNKQNSVAALRDTMQTRLGNLSPNDSPFTRNMGQTTRVLAAETGPGNVGAGQVAEVMLNRDIANDFAGPTTYRNDLTNPRQWGPYTDNEKYALAKPGSSLAASAADTALTEMMNGVPAPNATDFVGIHQKGGVTTKRSGTDVGGNRFGNFFGVSGDEMADYRSGIGSLGSFAVANATPEIQLHNTETSLNAAKIQDSAPGELPDTPFNQALRSGLSFLKDNQSSLQRYKSAHEGFGSSITGPMADKYVMSQYGDQIEAANQSVMDFAKGILTGKLSQDLRSSVSSGLSTPQDTATQDAQRGAETVQNAEGAGGITGLNGLSGDLKKATQYGPDTLYSPDKLNALYGNINAYGIDDMDKRIAAEQALLGQTIDASQYGGSVSADINKKLGGRGKIDPFSAGVAMHWTGDNKPVSEISGKGYGVTIDKDGNINYTRAFNDDGFMRTTNHMKGLNKDYLGISSQGTTPNEVQQQAAAALGENWFNPDPTVTTHGYQAGTLADKRNLPAENRRQEDEGQLLAEAFRNGVSDQMYPEGVDPSVIAQNEAVRGRPLSAEQSAEEKALLGRQQLAMRAGLGKLGPIGWGLGKLISNNAQEQIDEYSKATPGEKAAMEKSNPEVLGWGDKLGIRPSGVYGMDRYDTWADQHGLRGDDTTDRSSTSNAEDYSQYQDMLQRSKWEKGIDIPSPGEPGYQEYVMWLRMKRQRDLQGDAAGLGIS